MKTLYLLIVIFTFSLYSQNKIIVNLENGNSEEINIQNIENITYSSTFIPVEYIEANELFVEVGKTEPLIFTYEPENTSDTNFTFTSADEDIATVDSEGIVTGISDGLTDITIKGKLIELSVAVDVANHGSVKINNPKFTIYPNPANDIINIDTHFNLFEVNIIDAKGDLVYSNYDKKEINVSNFAAGAYTLVINHKNQYYSYKFIKK